MKIRKKRYGSTVLSFVLLMMLILLPVFISSSSYKLIFVANILMYVVLTVSWAMFSGPTGYISLATSAFFGVGVYSTALLSAELPLIFVILIGGIASFCLAYLVGSVTLRLKGMYFTMFTFGLVELIRNLLHWYEVNITGTVGRMVISPDATTIYYTMVCIFLAVLLTSYLIKRSRFGLALQGIGESEDAAAHTGINVTRVKSVIFAVSAFFMGLTGAAMSLRWSYVDPTMAFDISRSFMPVLMAIFGGMGHLYAPITGAAVFSILEEIFTTKFPYYYMLLFGLTMLLVIRFMPLGIEGVIERLLRRKNTGYAEKP
ncbi:MAG: branched-chain amino acid ABC transporter permease [Proteobacteria bacterium]|nr:branched-chain amino acid ABC transporter permease [Pseudomonadota bacterium]